MTASDESRQTEGHDWFGYVVDDSASFEWLDATTGEISSLRGDDAFEGPVDIGFDFPFYDRAYRECFVSTNGLLTFGEGSREYVSAPIPVGSPPNDLIAALWTDLCVNDDGCNEGAVYYLRGGAPPNRYLVVEWHGVSRLGSAHLATFEAVLHENGDVVLAYAQAVERPGDLTVGLENWAGDDGLRYDASGLTAYRVVRFGRPSPSGRVRVSPVQQGRFNRAGEAVVFEQCICNSGDLGPDTYGVAISSLWPATALALEGRALLDTDGDGEVDTGPVPQGDCAVVRVQVTAPVGSMPGAANAALVTVRSSRNPAQQATMVLRSCIPAPFAQAFGDSTDNATSLCLVHPTGQSVVEAMPDQPRQTWESPVVIELPSGNLFYGWSRERFLANGSYVHEIEYAVFGATGNLVQPLRKLVDHSTATRDVHEQELAVVAGSDGRIGVTWVRMVVDDMGREQYNVYFCVLGPTGDMVAGPVNVTGNSTWYEYGHLNVPRFESPTIGSVGTSFGIAWARDHLAASTDTCSDVCAVTDIYYVVYRPNGSAATGVRRLTNDTPGADDLNSRANLTSLSGDAAMISWTRGGAHGDVYYAVLNSAGQVTKAAGNLSGDGGGVVDSESDAVQLRSGRVVVAWTAASDIRFAVLGPDCDRLFGPFTLVNSAALLGNTGVSVASAGDMAVLTWQDAYAGYAPNLYYALLDASGAVLTPPMIFRTSAAVRPRLQASTSGHGNTSYHLAQFSTPTLSPVSPTPNASPTPSLAPTLTATGMPSETATLSPTPSGTATVTRTPGSFLTFLPVLVRILDMRQ